MHDLSQLLNTGLSREQLRACAELIESGVNAEAVAVSCRLEMSDSEEKRSLTCQSAITVHDLIDLTTHDASVVLDLRSTFATKAIVESLRKEAAKR